MNENVKSFTTINAAELMTQEFEPLGFAVDKILPHGLFILAGSGKIGKSWLSLDIGVTVAAGSKLWDFSAERGTALYLALEDGYPRLKDRLDKIKSENIDVSKLHLTTASFGIGSGLIEQVHNFVSEYPDTKLIIIDTLECVRDTESDKNIYSCDYRDMTLLREITNRHRLTLLLIHHTRKMYDPDPLNTLSGSTGLVGAVDGVFVLEKDKRISNSAKLTIANRDTEGFCFKLEFNPDKCKWSFIGNDADLADEKNEWLLLLVDDFLNKEWSGTATELCDALKKIDPDSDITPQNITKQLKSNIDLFKRSNISISFDRSRDSRTIMFKRLGS